jgi:nucleotide-binding universal stress UspA family protein
MMAAMFKRILVPVDDSPASSAGLRTALDLARDQKARLRLVHLGKNIPATRRKAGGMTAQELFEAMREQGRKLLERQAARCRARRVPTETALYVGLAGHPAKLVLAEARKWRADLIVMGTRGRRGLRRMVLRSDAEEVIRSAPVPVLLTRK